MKNMVELETKGKLAKEAARELVRHIDKIDAALHAMADALESNAPYILAENEKDMANAVENGMNAVLMDRLKINSARLKQTAEGIRQVAGLPCPLNKILHSYQNPNGMLVEKVTVPLGVIGIIYESRPNVTADAAALCIKAGNAVMLRGGKEAIFSNTAIARVLAAAAGDAGLPKGCIQLIEDTSRESSLGLMKLNEYLDAIFPRGGTGLIKAMMENATVPAIETGIGNCHVYVDASADLEMAENIAVNAKINRPSVCNAAEKLLVHRDIAKVFLPKVLHALAEKNVEIKGDGEVRAIYPAALPMTEDDWYEEYLAMIIGVKVVANVDEAIRHINKYSSGHSEAIVAEDTQVKERFLAEVDSSTLYANVSTRFTDGFEFGLGAEMGISTQKVHARGPIGLSELCSAKFIVRGNGQVRV
jgi:glutamate-5-semialdehyde dehydrogenase